MYSDWQTLTALAVVALAVAIVWRRLYRYLLVNDAEGGCGSCPSKQTSAEKNGLRVTPLVQLTANEPKQHS
jgi:hypothetical protein